MVWWVCHGHVFQWPSAATKTSLSSAHAAFQHSSQCQNLPPWLWVQMSYVITSDKGHFGSYMKLYDLILLSTILQLE